MTQKPLSPKNPLPRSLPQVIKPGRLPRESEQGVVSEKGDRQGGKTQEGAAAGIRAARIIPQPRYESVKHLPLVYGLVRCASCEADNKISYIPGKEQLFLKCQGCGELWPFKSYLVVALCNDFVIIDNLYKSRNKPAAYSPTR